MTSLENLLEKVKFERITRPGELGGLGTSEDADPEGEDQAVSQLRAEVGGIGERLGHAAGTDIALIELLVGHMILLEREVAALRQEIEVLRGDSPD